MMYQAERDMREMRALLEEVLKQVDGEAEIRGYGLIERPFPLSFRLLGQIREVIARTAA